MSRPLEVGPDLPSGVRRPDRSVSLPDPRETAAEMMGGLGNLPLKRLQKQRDDLIDQHEALGPHSRLYDQQRDELLEAIDEVERQIRELDPPPPPPPVEAFDLDDPAARKAALAKWGQRHVEPVPDLPPDVHEMAGVQEPDWWEEAFGPDTPVGGVEPIRPDPGLLPGTGGAPSFLPEGLDWGDTEAFLDKVEEAGGDLDDPSTWPEWALEQGSKPADEVDPTVWKNLSVAPPSVLAMLTHMASGGPGRIGRAHPERQPPPYEPAPPLTEEERKRGKEAIEKIRRDNPNIVNPESTMVPEESMLASIWGAITAALGQAGSSTLPHAQVGQAAMQQMQEMPPEDQVKIATLLLAGSAAASGIGGPLVPLILGTGAALSSQ